MEQNTLQELTRDHVAAIIDHTLLAPEATASQIEAFLADGLPLGVRRVCIAPTFVELAKRGSGFEVVTVVGFPSGAHEVAAKVREAELALAAGVDEIDAVANLGTLKSGDWAALDAELSQLRTAAAGHPLKIILETACLTDHEIVEACRVAVATGCDFVKTSTGFHPAGGASVHAVELMAATVGDSLGVKASGGIRSAADARAMLEAGATRLGVSATAQILAEWDAPGNTRTGASNTSTASTESAGY